MKEYRIRVRVSRVVIEVSETIFLYYRLQSHDELIPMLWKMTWRVSGYIVMMRYVDP